MLPLPVNSLPKKETINGRVEPGTRLQAWTASWYTTQKRIPTIYFHKRTKVNWDVAVAQLVESSLITTQRRSDSTCL